MADARRAVVSGQRAALPAARALHLLVPGAVWLCIHGSAAASDPVDAAFARLQEGGEVSCQPTLPYFCENMHVKCVGQTPVATFQFRLRGASGTGSVELVTASEEFERRYENAHVEWDKDGGYVLLVPRGASGYLKVLADAKYVFRHYIQSRGVMSLGACR